MVEEVFWSLGFGAIAGAIYGGISFFNNKTKEGVEEDLKQFNPKKFVTIVVSSAIFGAGANYTGMAHDAFAVSAYGVVLAQAVRKIVSMLYNRFTK